MVNCLAAIRVDSTVSILRQKAIPSSRKFSDVTRIFVLKIVHALSADVRQWQTAVRQFRRAGCMLESSEMSVPVEGDTHILQGSCVLKNTSSLIRLIAGVVYV